MQLAKVVFDSEEMAAKTCHYECNYCGSVTETWGPVLKGDYSRYKRRNVKMEFEGRE